MTTADGIVGLIDMRVNLFLVAVERQIAIALGREQYRWRDETSTPFLRAYHKHIRRLHTPRQSRCSYDAYSGQHVQLYDSTRTRFTTRITYPARAD